MKASKDYSKQSYKPFKRETAVAGVRDHSLDHLPASTKLLTVNPSDPSLIIIIIILLPKSL